METTFENHTIKISKNAKGLDTLLIVRPAKTKTGIKVVAHWSFKSIDSLFAWLKKWEGEILNRKSHIETKKAAKQEAKKQGHGFKVGDLFYDSWGWEQTNIDFYQVTAVTQGSVKIRPIASKLVRTAGWASEYVSPDKDNFTGDEETKIVQYMVSSTSKGSTSTPYIKSRHGWISPCTENKECLATHYA